MPRHVFMILRLHLRNAGMFSSSRPDQACPHHLRTLYLAKVLSPSSPSLQLRLHDLTSALLFAMTAKHISLYHRDTLHPIIHLPQGKNLVSVAPSRHQKETYCHCPTGQMFPVLALMGHFRKAN